MMKKHRWWVSGAASVIYALAASLAAEQAAPRPKPAPSRSKATAKKPAPARSLPGAILVAVDAPAYIEVDDQKVGLVRPEAMRRIDVTFGQHVVRATSAEVQTVRVRQVAEVTAAGQVIVRVEMLPELLVPRPCSEATSGSQLPPGAGESAAMPVRAGSANIEAPRKVKHVPPVYPPVAQSARVEGIVIVQATIGPTGMVEGACILRSIPLLDAAAVAAVRQWEFTPTRLNGVGVPVIMTVTVNFALH